MQYLHKLTLYFKLDQNWLETNNFNFDFGSYSIYFILKGLATHTDADVKEYFTNKVKNNKIFKWCGEGDFNAIELGFSGERASERKFFIKNAMDLIIKRPQVISLHLSLHVNCYLTCWSNKLGICMLQDTILKKDAEYISYRDFIHKELVHYSVSNVRRSIPSLVDGLKPSQRKILCAALDGGLKSEDMVNEGKKRIHLFCVSLVFIVLRCLTDFFLMYFRSTNFLVMFAKEQRIIMVELVWRVPSLVWHKIL